MLLILATVRGAYASLEQPSGSQMKFFPDLVRTGELIQKYVGKFWKEQFLSGVPDHDSFSPGILFLGWGCKYDSLFNI